MHKIQPDEIESLNSLNESINESLSLSKIARATLAEIHRVISPDLAFIFIRKGEELVCLDSIADDSGLLQVCREPHYVGQCLCGLAGKEEIEVVEFSWTLS